MPVSAWIVRTARARVRRPSTRPGDHARDVAAARVPQKPEGGWSLPSPWSPDPPGLCDRRRRGEKSVEPLLFSTKRPYSAGETLVLYQYRSISRKVLGASWLFRPLPLRERVGRRVAPVSSTLRTRRLVVPSPPLPNPLPRGEREPEVPSTKGVIASENEPNCQRTLLTQGHRRLSSSGLGNGRSRPARRREGRLLAGSGWVGLRGLRGADRRNQGCFNFHGSNERAVAASLATGHLFQFPWDHETAVAARSARVFRPRRSADRTSPGHAPTIGDWETRGRRGRAGQETLPEPVQ